MFSAQHLWNQVSAWNIEGFYGQRGVCVPVFYCILFDASLTDIFKQKCLSIVIFRYRHIYFTFPYLHFDSKSFSFYIFEWQMAWDGNVVSTFPSPLSCPILCLVSKSSSVCVRVCVFAGGSLLRCEKDEVIGWAWPRLCMYSMYARTCGMQSSVLSSHCAITISWFASN